MSVTSLIVSFSKTKELLLRRSLVLAKGCSRTGNIFLCSISLIRTVEGCSMVGSLKKTVSGAHVDVVTVGR